MRIEIPLVVIDQNGNPVANATVQVSVRGGGLASLFSFETGGGTVANPTTTDLAGRVNGWVERGAYDALVTAPGLTSYTEQFEATPARDGAIDTAWIAGGAVTGAKIATGAVTTTQILDGSILGSDLQGFPSAATQFYRGDGTWAVLSFLTGSTVTALNPTADGRPGVIHVGSPVSDYLPVTYDSTLGRWVSTAQIGHNLNVGGTINGTVDCGSFAIRAQPFTDAGLTLQVRATGYTYVNTSATTALIQWSADQIGRGANDLTSLMGATTLVNVASVTTAVGISHEWTNVTNPTKDTVIINAIAVGPTTGTIPVLIWKGSIMYRWIG